MSAECDTQSVLTITDGSFDQLTLETHAGGEYADTVLAKVNEGVTVHLSEEDVDALLEFLSKWERS